MIQISLLEARKWVEKGYKAKTFVKSLDEYLEIDQERVIYLINSTHYLKPVYVDIWEIKADHKTKTVYFTNRKRVK